MKPAKPVAGIVGSLLIIAVGGSIFLPELREYQVAAETVPDLPNVAVAVAASIGLFVLFILSALLAASRSALEEIRPHQIRHFKDENAKRGVQLQELFERREAHATACELGSRIVRIGLATLVLILAPRIGALLPQEGAALSYKSVLIGAALLGLPVAFLNLVLGEIVPRAYGQVRPTVVLLRLRRLIRGTSALLSWPARRVVSLAGIFTTRFGGTAVLGGVNALEEEIKSLAESGAEAGQIERDERELIHSVFEFADTVAREIMTPRVELDAMPVKSDPADVVRIIEETGHSRIPLFEETDDEILGVVHAKDLLSLIAQGKAVDLRKLLRPVLTVHEGKGVRDLLQEMRHSRTQMAIVQDEYGGTAGVVTIEDIVEELVGDIVDEYDAEESEVMDVEGGWLIAGKIHLDDLNDQIGSQFESDEFDTIGGFVFGQFGRQPQEGESVDIERYRFTVTETDGRRVGMLRIEPIGEPSLSELD